MQAAAYNKVNSKSVVYAWRLERYLLLFLNHESVTNETDPALGARHYLIWYLPCLLQQASDRLQQGCWLGKHECTGNYNTNQNTFLSVCIQIGAWLVAFPAAVAPLAKLYFLDLFWNCGLIHGVVVLTTRAVICIPMFSYPLDVGL